MKFSIVLFLAVCAVAVNAMYFEPAWEENDNIIIEPQNAVTDKIKGAIVAILKKASESINFMGGKMKAIMRKMNEEAGELAQIAKNKANVIKGQIQGKINEMKEKGGEVADCAKALEPEYWKVEKDLMANLKKCAEDVYVATGEMKKEVSNVLSKFNEFFGNVGKAVAECFGLNPITVAKCLKEKVDLITNEYDEMMRALNASYKAVQAKSAEIMQGSRQCNANAIEKAKSEVAALNDRLAKCYKFDDEIFYY